MLWAGGHAWHAMPCCCSQPHSGTVHCIVALPLSADSMPCSPCCFLPSRGGTCGVHSVRVVFQRHALSCLTCRMLPGRAGPPSALLPMPFMQTATHLFVSEGHAVLPAPAELAGSDEPTHSGDSGQSPDPHHYYGCFVGHNAAVDGTWVRPCSSLVPVHAEAQCIVWVLGRQMGKLQHLKAICLGRLLVRLGWGKLGQWCRSGVARHPTARLVLPLATGGCAAGPA